MGSLIKYLIGSRFIDFYLSIARFVISVMMAASMVVGQGVFEAFDGHFDLDGGSGIETESDGALAAFLFFDLFGGWLRIYGDWRGG